jgi:lysozyme family protein
VARFDECLDFVLDREGGTSEPAGDPDTAYGITQPTFTAYLTKRGLPVRDVDTITQPEYEDIYRTSYWRAAKCDDLPKPIDLVMFDTAVNSGVGAAGRLLQEALGQGLVIDGVIGTKTLMAAAMADPLVVAARMVKGRINKYVVLALSGKRHVLKGWLRRLGHLLQAL